MNCEKCGSSKIYDHEEELGVTSDCQTCGHWTFEKYDWVKDENLSNDTCNCEACQKEKEE